MEVPPAKIGQTNTTGEEYYSWPPRRDVCPGCGRCPVCGRSAREAYPQPYYPAPYYGPVWPQTWPVWSQPSITWTVSQ